MGKSSINWQFSMAMLNNQRVIIIIYVEYPYLCDETRVFFDYNPRIRFFMHVQVVNYMVYIRII